MEQMSVGSRALDHKRYTVLMYSTASKEVVSVTSNTTPRWSISAPSLRADLHSPFHQVLSLPVRWSRLI